MRRLLTMMMILGVSLGVAKKKVEHNWQTGTLVRIVTQGETYIPEVHLTWQIGLGASGVGAFGAFGASGLMFQGTDKGQDGYWFAVLGAKQREPNVHAGTQYKFAVETIRCTSWDSCGGTWTKDEFGRVWWNKITSKQILYLVDEDGRETKLDKAEFKQARQ